MSYIQSGYVKILPLLMLFLFVTTTVLIAVRIQNERVGELRRFAGCDQYNNCGGSPAPSISPQVSPGVTPGSEQPKGGFTLEMILNPDSNTAANRTGYNCSKGGCPAGVEVSGFYKAPNGRYYPVSGGPSSSDLAYVYKKVEEKVGQYAELKQKLATCGTAGSSACTSIQSQMSKLQFDLGYTTAKLNELTKIAPIDEKKVKALEAYQTIIEKYQTCASEPGGVTSSTCIALLNSAKQFATANGLTAEESKSIDRLVKVNGLINSYVEAGLKLSECQADKTANCAQYTVTMNYILRNTALTADDIKLAKDTLAKNNKITSLLNTGVTNGLTQTQIVNNLVTQTGVTTAEARKMVAQAALSMATNVLDALQKTTPGGEVAIFTQLFPKEKTSACAKDITCVQKKLQEYMHANAPTLETKYASAIKELNLSRELAQASTDTTGYAAAQLLASLKVRYKTELGTANVTNLDQAIAILNKKLPDHLQTDVVNSSDIEAIIRQATGQLPPKTSLQNAYELYKNQRTPDGVRISPEKEKALQKAFEAEQLAALERIRGDLDNDFNKTYAAFLKGEVVPTQLEDKLHPLVTMRTPGSNPLNPTVSTRRVGTTWLNTAIQRIESSLDKTFGMSASEAKSETEGVIDLYGLKVNSQTKLQLEAFYQNKAKLESAGYFRAGEESEQALIREIAAGNFDVKKKVESMGSVGAAAMEALHVIDSVGNGWVTQRLYPNLTNIREAGVAKTYVNSVVSNDPTILTAVQNKIQTDEETKKAYETYKASAPADEKTIKDFIIHQYQAALDVQDKATTKIYDAPAIHTLFPAGTQDASWLRQAALEGTVDVVKLASDLDAAKKASTLAENELHNQSYQRGNTQANIARAQTVVTEKNYVQAELLAQAYINSIPQETRDSLQVAMDTKLKERNITVPVAQYQAQQLASYLNDKDVQFLMGSGGVNITMDGVLNGTYDMKVATKVLADIKANDPLAAAALSLNKFENGALLQGQMIMNDPKSTFGDKFRAGVMMSAKPALTAVAIIVPPLRIVQLAGTAITASTALAVAGDAMGIYMTGSSLQDTATVCTMHDDMDTTACLKSAGMTLFAASSALSSASQLNSLARAARVTRLEQGVGTSVVEKLAQGMDTIDIGWTSTVGKTLAKNPVTSLLVSKGNLAVADLAVFTRQAGATSFESVVAALPKAQQVALNVSAMTTAEKVAFTNQALTATQARIAQNLATTVYSGAAESMVLQTARNGLGTLVFGSAAVDACSQAVDLNCLTSIGLASVSFSRLITAPYVASAPQSLVARSITRADQLVNYSQAAVACSASALGEAPAENCMTNIMFAGLSAGQTAIRDAQSAAPIIDDPFTLRTQAIADAAVLGNEFYSGKEVMINGKTVYVTGDNRAELLADVQARLSRATTAMAQVIGRTNSLVAGKIEDAKRVDPNNMSAADKKLATAIDAWRALVNKDGSIKEFLIVDGPAEANGTPSRITVTDRMVEDAYRAVTASERQVAIEAQLKAYPERSVVEQLGDRFTEMLGRDVPVLSDFEKARTAFIDASKNADTNPVAYEVAVEQLEKAKTAVERSSMTKAQQEYAKQLDAEQEALRQTQADMELVQLRIELLKDSDRIDQMAVDAADAVREASGNLVRAIAGDSDEIVLAAARKKLSRTQDVYEAVNETKNLNDTITGEGRRATIIRSENDLKLGPLVTKQLESFRKIASLEQSIEAGSTLQGRVSLAVAQIFDIKPSSVENVSAREVRMIKDLISKQLGMNISEENIALYREFSKASSEVNRVLRSISILDRYDPARTGIESPLTETRARRLAQIEEISKGYFQEILPDGTPRSLADIRADIERQIPVKRGLFRTQSNTDVLTAIDALMKEHQALVTSADREAVLVRHEAAMTELNNALEALYGRDSTDFLNASIAVRRSLKQIDLTTQVEAARARGDMDLVAKLQKSAEVNLSMFDSLNPNTRLKLENIIRDTEYRLTIYEQDFRSLRAKQLETIFGLLSNDGTAIELTTSGGKTWVVSAISRIQNEVFGRKAVIVFRKGQAGQLTDYVKSVYGSEDAVVRVTSDMFQGDERVTAEALKRIEDAKVIVVEPEDLPFLRNMATMKYDNPKVRADVIHAYLSAVSNAGFSIDELNLALDTNSRMINPANGQASAQIEELILGVNEDVGRVILDLNILEDGKFDAWRTSENGKPALTEGYQVIKTNPDGSVTMQVIKNAKFTDVALERLLPALEKKFGLDEGVLRKVSELRDARLGNEAYAKALADAGISPESGAKAVDVLGAINHYANVMTAVPGTAYFRGVNVYGARVTIPGSEGVASTQQTYNKYLQPVYEIVGALAHGEGFIPLRGSGLAVAPELAYQSTVADVIADAMILSGNVQIGGVTGTIGSAYDVLANAYRMVTNVDGETARRIFDEGRLTQSRFTVARPEDIVRVLAEQIRRGMYDTSIGLNSRGNLKITIGGDLGLSTLDVAREIVRQTGKTDKTFVIGVNGDTFYEVKLNADGTIADGYADESGNPNKVITTDEVSRWYMNEGRENVISILDRGSATGGNIRTPEYVPGALLTSDTAPEYLVLQAASRLDRTGGLADQHLLLAKATAQAFGVDGVSLEALQGTPDQFGEFRKNAIAVQDAYAKEQSAQANTLGMELAASRPLAHGVMMFGTIDSPAARQVADWLSDKLLELSTHTEVQDTSLKQKTTEEVTADTQQKTLAARNERFKQLVEFYDRLFENPDNQPYLNLIQETAPDIYTRMLNSRNALVDVPQGADPLAYAIAQGGTSKDAPLLQGDLGSYRNAHNISVTQDSEAFFTGGTVDEKRIAQARSQTEIVQNEQLAEGILSQQGKTAAAIAERAKTSTRQLSTRNRETLALAERAVAFYQQRVAQANSLIALNALQREQRVKDAAAVGAGDVIVGMFEPARLAPCAVYTPFRVFAAAPCAPAGSTAVAARPVAVTLTNGTKATYTDMQGQTHEYVFDTTSATALPLSAITTLVLHYESGDVTISEEDLRGISAGNTVKAISIETYLNASQTIQTITQQLNSWGITDTTAAVITQSVRRDAENRIRSTVGGGTLDKDALSRAVDALIAYEQAAYSDLVSMSSGDRKAMTVDLLDQRTAVSRAAAATALRALLPGGTETEASERLSRVTKQPLSDIIVAQRKEVEKIQAKAAAQKRSAAQKEWWKGLGTRIGTALTQQTQYGNVVSFVKGLFARQPVTGKITIAKTAIDAAFLDIGEGRYSNAYVIINTARARNVTSDPDVEKITAELRNDIARRLSRAIGISVAQDHPSVTTMFAYEAAFVQAAAAWTGDLNVQRSAAIFAEDIDRDTGVASLRRNVIAEIQRLRELTTLEQDISPDAVFGIVAQPLVASTYALIQTENPAADSGAPVNATEQIAALRRGIAQHNYMAVYRAYAALQSIAQRQPIVMNTAMEIIQRDVAERLSAELQVPIAWDHAAVSRIADYELGVLAFTDTVVNDPTIVDESSYIGATHANRMVNDALVQAEAVYDTLAAPLGIQRDTYNNGLRRIVNPVMESVWNEMQLDAKIAARVATARELQAEAKGSTRWQKRPTPNAWVQTANAVRAFFFPRLTDLRGFPTATPNNVSALTSYTLRYAGVALIPGVGPALAGGIFMFDLAHTLLDQFGGLVVRIPPLQRFLLMDSPRIMAWLERTNTRNTSLQVLKNIVAGSREGWIESIVNATFLDIGNPNWTPVSAITRGVFMWGIHSAILPLHVWDIYRAAQAYTERVTGVKSPVLEYGYEKPDYWGQNGWTFGLIPRWIVNATPQNNALVYILTRGILPGGQLLIPYDVHRMTLGEGWRRLSVASFNPLAWRWLDIPKRSLATPAPVRPTAQNTTQQESVTGTPTNSNQAQTDQSFSTRVRQFAARVITASPRVDRGMYWISRIALLVPGPFWAPRALIVLGFDASRLAASLIAGNQALLARVEVFVGRSGGLYTFLNANPLSGFGGTVWYVISRAVVLPAIVAGLGLVFGVMGLVGVIPAFLVTLFVPFIIGYDTLRVGMWAHNLGQTVVRTTAVRQPAPRQSTPIPVVQVTNLTGYTITGVTLPNGVAPGIGVDVTAHYINDAGNRVDIHGRIRNSAGFNQTSWSITLDGMNSPVVINESQFTTPEAEEEARKQRLQDMLREDQAIQEQQRALDERLRLREAARLKTTVSELPPALAELVSDLSTDMAPAERMMELADDIGVIGEILGQTPRQIFETAKIVDETQGPVEDTIRGVMQSTLPFADPMIEVARMIRVSDSVARQALPQARQGITPALPSQARQTPTIAIDEEVPAADIQQDSPTAPTGDESLNNQPIEPIHTAPIVQPIPVREKVTGPAVVISPDKLPTRDLTEDEVWSIVQENAEIRALDSEETRRLVRTYIHGVQIGGVNTLVISQEYDAKQRIGPLDTIIFALIKDQRSKPPMIEYFSPEIIKNAENVPLIGRWLVNEFRRQEANEELGYVKAKYHDELAAIAAKEGKDVVIGDIANRLRYYTLLPTWVTGGSLIVASLINPWAGVITSTILSFTDIVRFYLNTGTFDRAHIHWYEFFELQHDDGRRMYIAQSLRQLAAENQLGRTGRIQELPIQLVVYPPAHALRISRYLHPKNQLERVMRNVKLLLYRASGFLGLDFSIRQFHRDESSGEWSKVGEKSMGIFYSPQGTFEDPEMPRTLQGHLQRVRTPILGPLYRFVVRRSVIPVLRFVNFVRDFRYLGGNGAILWAIDQAQESLFRMENGVFIDSRIQQITTDILSNADEAARLDAIEALRRIVRPYLMDAALAARGNFSETDVQQMVNRLIERNLTGIRGASLFIRGRQTKDTSPIVSSQPPTRSDAQDSQPVKPAEPADFIPVNEPVSDEKETALVPNDTQVKQTGFNRDAFSFDHPILSWLGAIGTVYAKGFIVSGLVLIVLLATFGSFTLMAPMFASLGPVVAFIYIFGLTAMPWMGLRAEISDYISKVDMTRTIADVMNYKPSAKYLQSLSSAAAQDSGADEPIRAQQRERGQMARIAAYIRAHPVIGWSVLILAGIITVAAMVGIELYVVMVIHAAFMTFGGAFVSLVKPTVVLALSMYLAFMPFVMPFVWVDTDFTTSVSQLTNAVFSLLDKETKPVIPAKQGGPVTPSADDAADQQASSAHSFDRTAYTGEENALVLDVDEYGLMQFGRTGEARGTGGVEILFLDEETPEQHYWVIRNVSGEGSAQVQDPRYFTDGAQLRGRDAYRLYDGTTLTLETGEVATVSIDPDTNTLTITPITGLSGFFEQEQQGEQGGGSLSLSGGSNSFVEHAKTIQPLKPREVMALAARYFNVDMSRVDEIVTREQIDLENINQTILMATIFRSLNEQGLWDIGKERDLKGFYKAMRVIQDDGLVHTSGASRLRLVNELMRTMEAILHTDYDRIQLQTMAVDFIRITIQSLQNTKENRDRIRSLIGQSVLSLDKQEGLLEGWTLDASVIGLLPNRVIEISGLTVENFTEDRFREALALLTVDELYALHTYRKGDVLQWIGGVALDWTTFHDVYTSVYFDVLYSDAYTSSRLVRWLLSVFPNPKSIPERTIPLVPLTIHFIPFKDQQDSEYDAQAIGLGLVDFDRSVRLLQNMPWYTRPLRVRGTTNATMALFAMRTLGFRLEKPLEITTPEGVKRNLEAVEYIEAHPEQIKAKDREIKITIGASNLIRSMKAEKLQRLLARARRNERANRLTAIMAERVGVDPDIIARVSRIAIDDRASLAQQEADNTLPLSETSDDVLDLHESPNYGREFVRLFGLLFQEIYKGITDRDIFNAEKWRRAIRLFPDVVATDVKADPDAMKEMNAKFTTMIPVIDVAKSHVFGTIGMIFWGPVGWVGGFVSDAVYHYFIERPFTAQQYASFVLEDQQYEHIRQYVESLGLSSVIRVTRATVDDYKGLFGTSGIINNFLSGGSTNSQGKVNIRYLKGSRLVLRHEDIHRIQYLNDTNSRSYIESPEYNKKTMNKMGHIIAFEGIDHARQVPQDVITILDDAYSLIFEAFTEFSRHTLETYFQEKPLEIRGMRQNSGYPKEEVALRSLLKEIRDSNRFTSDEVDRAEARAMFGSDYQPLIAMYRQVTGGHLVVRMYELMNPKKSKDINLLQSHFDRLMLEQPSAVEEKQPEELPAEVSIPSEDGIESGNDQAPLINEQAPQSSVDIPRVSIVQTNLTPVPVGAPVVQTPSENPIHRLWLTGSAVQQDAITLSSIDEYVQRIITSASVDPTDIEALDNYIEALFRQYYIDNTLRFSYPDTVLGRYMTMLRSLLVARTSINDSDMTALSITFGKLIVPVLREQLLSAARDAHDGTPVLEMDSVAFLMQIQTTIDEVVTNYAKSHLKKGLFGLGGASYSEFETPWRNLPQSVSNGQVGLSRSAIVGVPVGGAAAGAWFGALWTSLPGVQFWTTQILSQPEETWNLLRVWMRDQYDGMFTKTVDIYERAILRASPEPVPVCIP